jgi:hypothetical protein
MTEVDERYQRGMIYTIKNITDDTKIYVGSTMNNLSKRFYTHKSDCKSGKRISLYSYIENNDWSNWYIEWYEDFPCNSKKELNRREGQVIREIGTINKQIAGRTVNEYREDNVDKIKKYYKENIDKIKEQKKKYYKKNIDIIKEKVKKYRKENIDKVKEKQKKYREENIDNIKKYREDNANKIKKYREENADKINFVSVRTIKGVSS